jgi:large subunit ribosomal protein L21e
MVKGKGGPRKRTRAKLSKSHRQKGKISLTKYFQSFNEGDKVMLKPEPSVHKGMYDGRFIGKTGTVIRRNGTCYEVTIQDGSKKKMLIVHPVHLKRAV